MRSLLHHIYLLLCVCMYQPLQAQLDMQGEASGADVLVQGRNKASEAGELIFQSVWRNVPGGNATFQFQRMAAPAQDHRLMLDELMEIALGAYLDKRIHFSKQGVTADLPAHQLMLEMNAMISAAVEEFSMNASSKGLSSASAERLERLVNIDWSQAQFAVNGGDAQDKYLAIYYYVRSQREEFERQMRTDLLSLATIAVLGEEEPDPAQTVHIASSCGTVFDQDKYLCALDLQLADTGAGGFDVELAKELDLFTKASEPPITTMEDEDRVRKRDRWLKAELDKINERIDKLDQRKELWELRDRIDDLDDRLTGLELEIQEGSRSRGEGNPLADLSDLSGHNIMIRFARNSITIDPEYRVLLNEVFEQLVRSPLDKILITGYADQVGDPALNLKLSEQRAKAVREHLLQQGISPERLLINFYGASRSLVHDPSERRVEIEWIKGTRR